MAWPPPQAQVDPVGNMAGFGARKMQEEQQLEAQRQYAEWEKAEAERRQIEYSRQLEVERQTLEQERQRIAWEWSELQRQQVEHEQAKARFQQEQLYAAEQQRLQSEAELQRIQAEHQHQFAQQQQHFEQQQQQLEHQQEELQRHQHELQQQHQSQQAELLEQQQKLKKAEIEVQRKIKAQALAAQKLKEEQSKLTAYIQHTHALDQPGDDTLQPIQEPQPQEDSRLKKSSRPRQRTPSTVQSSAQRTKAWAAEHADSMMAYCSDCRQDVLFTQLENHHCMRRNNSDGSSQESLRAPEIPTSAALTVDSRTPSPGIRTRSPFFERHQELERARDLAGTSPHSPSLSPIWPNTYANGRSNSHDGGLLIRRTPSEDERERLISTPSPIPPDLSPEEEAAIRAERKRRIELQREAKKNGGTSVAATAIIAALRFENLARAAAPNRTASPSPMSARDELQKPQMLAESTRSGLPKDKFPSSSSLASTQSSLLSAGPSGYARDRAYSGSSAALTPSTSYEFGNTNIASPDPSTSSRSRTKSSNSQKAGSSNNGAVAAAATTTVRLRLDSEPSIPHLARSRMDSDPLTPSRLRVDTTTAVADEYQFANKVRKDPSGKRLDLVEGLRPLQIPDPISTRDRSRSVASRTGASGGGGGKDSLSPSLSSPAGSLHPDEVRVRNRSGSLSPLNARRALPSDSISSSISSGATPQRRGTGGSSSGGGGTASPGPTPDVDLRGIEDLMRGLESDEMLEEHRRRRAAQRERARTDSGGLKASNRSVGAFEAAAAARTGTSPQLRAGADLAAAAASSIRPAMPSMPKTGRIR